ncbi:MAG: hypothetical protein NT154_23675 [Verrucomicrobia bacterium]|nr:hypothetical protein [Verrucomicrobiota bacterium]
MEPKTRTTIPKPVETQVLTASQRKCCLCYYLTGNRLHRKGQLAHLNHDRSDSNFDNLAYLCLEHHDELDSRPSQSKGFTTEEVRTYRDRLYRELAPDPQAESGAPKRRSVGLFLLNHEIHSHETWCYCFPDYAADKTCVMLRLQVLNKGEFTCDGAMLTVEAAKDLLSAYSPKKGHPTHRVYPAILKDDFKCAVGDTDNLHRHVSYGLPPIHPRTEVALDDFIFLSPTVDIPESTEVKTKDRKAVAMRWRMSLSWPMDLILTATDCRPVRTHIDIFGVKATTVSHALQTLLRVASIPPSKQQPRPSLLKRLLSQLTPTRAPESHIRFLLLKESSSQTIDKKKVITFEVEAMERAVLRAPLNPLSMRPKVELLDIEPAEPHEAKSRR